MYDIIRENKRHEKDVRWGCRMATNVLFKSETVQNYKQVPIYGGQFVILVH